MIEVYRKYQDVMDPSRTVVPMNDKGDCRIYFDDVYVGNAHVAPSLFTEAKVNEFVGFHRAS
jgi:hypothetical protein